jgi:hypothetical protein
MISTSAKPEDVIIYTTSPVQKEVTLATMAGGGIVNIKNNVFDAGTF